MLLFVKNVYKKDVMYAIILMKLYGKLVNHSKMMSKIIQVIKVKNFYED